MKSQPSRAKNNISSRPAMVGETNGPLQTRVWKNFQTKPKSYSNREKGWLAGEKVFLLSGGLCSKKRCRHSCVTQLNAMKFRARRRRLPGPLLLDVLQDRDFVECECVVRALYMWLTHVNIQLRILWLRTFLRDSQPRVRNAVGKTAV